MSARQDDLLDEQQLEALLRDAFLDEGEKAENLHDMNAQIVFSEELAVSAAPAKESALIARLGIRRLPAWRLNSLWWLAPLLIAAAAFVFWPKEKRTTEIAGAVPAAAASAPQENVSPAPPADTLAQQTAAQQEQTFAFAATSMENDPVDIGSAPKLTRREENEAPFKEGYNPSPRRRQFFGSGDDIPELSEAEKKRCQKNKLELLQNLAKKKTTVEVKGGPAWINGKRWHHGASTFAQTEVNNRDYRTFLHDLLIQGRLEEYLEARPKKGNWAKAGFQKIEERYDSPGYDKFPVVNITRKGAELFCRWLSESFAAAVEKKQVKWTNAGRLEFRLPDEHTWRHAARGGDSTATYPWNLRDVQNMRGCYLANFNVQKSQGKLRVTDCAANKHKDAPTSAGQVVDTLVATVDVYSYNPNAFGLYNMAGNVAEMVWAWDADAKKASDKPLAIGGSFNDGLDALDINAKEMRAGETEASPTIGFRYEVITVSKPLTKTTSYVPKKGGPARTVEVPVIGETTQLAVQKKKKQMIDALVSVDKDVYAYIPMGTFNSHGTTKSVQAFYMQRNEVTNLEYNTFLNDLVLQGRYEEYDKARIRTEVWNTEFPYSVNEPMERHYATHPAYDNYPVVNITAEGAELYCDWLTTETHKMYGGKGKKEKFVNDLRLPADLEWEYAAKAGSDTAIYPWPGKFVRDAKGTYLCNFSPLVTDSLGKTYHNFNIDGAFHMAVTGSYKPNAYGLYNMAGNVAEMVWVHENSKFFSTDSMRIDYKAKGGSWFSTEKDILIESSQEFENGKHPTPLIGFRPVMTYLKLGKEGDL